jgi:alanyl aminopeptidase
MSPALLLAMTALVPSLAAAAANDPARLGQDVVPTFQSLALDLDPDQKTYSGTARFELSVKAASDSFRLHARDMTLTRVALRQGKATVPITTRAGEIGLLTLRAAKPLAKGAATLEIDFTKDFDTRANSLYRVEARGRAYAFTDFEPDDARGAFPCFDEPAFKIPWQVTVTIPKEHGAFSNTLPEKETVVGEKRVVVFRRTPPLPTYLVAVITGPFDTLPIAGLSVPGRIVAVEGSAHLGAQAAKETPPILDALERWFGSKYPYGKLDLIAVPEFSAGAMENAAAVTYRENRLLIDPRSMSPAQRRGLIGITAHELAHMWFGDLVTMAWWDDLWLNESFASWMADKITEEVAPEFRVSVDGVGDAQRAMATDSRLTTRPIRATQLATDNLTQNFDVLSYQKGQAVLEMLERWLTPEKLRDGVRAYIAAHANANATAADLWAALSKAAGQDVAAVAGTFLDQPGVPIVTVEPLGQGRVRLAQRRFLNHGLEEPGRALWRIPVTLKYEAGGRARTQDVLLADSVQTVRLEDGAIPAWIHPNAEEKGYYRWSVPDGMLAALAEGAEKSLSLRERIGFVGNLRALLAAGQVPGDRFLATLGGFARDPEPEVVAAVLEALTGVIHPFVMTETRGDFAAYVRSTFRPALERIGMEPRPGEPPTVSVLRPRLMQWLGDEGRDPRVLERGRALAAAYMKDPAAVDPSLHQAALELAALRGDAALLQTYQSRFEKAGTPTERQHFLAALGAFADTAVAPRALAYALRGPLRPQEILSVANALGMRPELRDVVFEWTLENYDAIASRIPPSSVPNLPRQAGGCSLERVERARAFFAAPARNPLGTAKELERTEAIVRECVSLHQREGAAAARYLRQVAAAVE